MYRSCRKRYRNEGIYFYPKRPWGEMGKKQWINYPKRPWDEMGKICMCGRVELLMLR
jgi:hypothetical protein